MTFRYTEYGTYSDSCSFEITDELCRQLGKEIAEYETNDPVVVENIVKPDFFRECIDKPYYFEENGVTCNLSKLVYTYLKSYAAELCEHLELEYEDSECEIIH